MFGEAESESPRVPSPWDALSSSNAPSPCLGPTQVIDRKRALDSIPKLAPEVEEGNVEYKLKLINPSPERFTRLCTQLKWRLLEGGGQAYYELGVADSGQLIGLTREDMEKSLETLEMMAGEIGASVIVVKEIEVPGQLIDPGLRVHATAPGPTQTDSLSPSPEPENASPGAKQRLGYSPSSLGILMEDETPSATDGDDDGSDELDEAVTPESDAVPHSAPRPIAQGPHLNAQRRRRLRGSATSSPSAADNNLPAAQEDADDVEAEYAGTHFTLDDLEIQTVYKPRPSRSPPARYLAASPGSKAARRQQQHSHSHSAVTGSGGTLVNETSQAQGGGKPSRKHHKGAKHALSPEEKQQRLAMQRAKRDQKREEKRRALLALAGLDDDANADAGDGTLGLYHHEGTATTVPAVVVEADSVLAKDRLGTVSLNVADTGQLEVELPTRTLIQSASDVGTESPPRKLRRESRIIIEALVVRKLALEEAFLDFGGFSLGP